jgi:hypothetical protein
MEWKIEDVEEPFDELFERAEREGPQRVEHRGKHFLVMVEQGGKEGNAFIRALLDEPEFVDIGIERIDAPVRDTEW